MFTLNLSSTQTVAASLSAADIIDLTSSVFAVSSAKQQFPPPGSNASFDFVVHSKLPFELQCSVSFGSETLEFRYVNLHDGDTLNVVRHETSAFTATVFHRQKAVPAVRCLAVCSDGTQASGCVECKSGKLRGKICC